MKIWGITALIIFAQLLFIHHSMAAVAESQKLLVAEFLDGDVYVVDTNTLTQTEALPPADISAMAITDYKDYLYFVYTLSIDIVNKSGMIKTATIDYDGFCSPDAIRTWADYDGKKLYIGVIGWGKAATSGIFEIDLVSKTQRKVIAENAFHSGLIGMSPDRLTVYYGRGSGLYSLNTSDDSTSEIAALGPHELAYDIAYGPRDNLYVALHLYPRESNAKNEILEFELNSHQQKRLRLSSEPKRLLYAPDKKLYALGEDLLYQIDTDDYQLTNTFAISGCDLAMTSDASKLFVSSPKTGEVLVINPHNGALIKKLKIGKEPYALYIY